MDLAGQAVPGRPYRVVKLPDRLMGVQRDQRVRAGEDQEPQLRPGHLSHTPRPLTRFYMALDGRRNPQNRRARWLSTVRGKPPAKPENSRGTILPYRGIYKSIIPRYLAAWLQPWVFRPP